AGTLGGCTAHNAMITITPQDCDWNHIAELTGDESWRADHMNRYFARMENCKHEPPPGSFWYVVRGLWGSLIGACTARRDWLDWAHGHGFYGWLTTSWAPFSLVLKDKEILHELENAAKTSFHSGLISAEVASQTLLDPNDTRSNINGREGVTRVPLAVAN